jgi:hypothetical protein
MEEWTLDAISERLHREICEYDDNQPSFHGKSYYIRVIKYAQRRAIVQDPGEFIDVIQIFIENFSPQLKQQIVKLSSELQAIDQVISNEIRRIIKSRALSVYYDFLQYEPL